jgi:hypothetical protein
MLPSLQPQIYKRYEEDQFQIVKLELPWKI